MLPIGSIDTQLSASVQISEQSGTEKSKFGGRTRKMKKKRNGMKMQNFVTSPFAISVTVASIDTVAKILFIFKKKNQGIELIYQHRPTPDHYRSTPLHENRGAPDQCRGRQCIKRIDRSPLNCGVLNGNAKVDHLPITSTLAEKV
ncbi:hypothetical protein F2Q70_00022844 [Brassica cretica]|uniref:Uncharacterized protein n=1 Tax=Brassica cretica TaxID=69181 RepID=A0A8S9GUZ4_BRACR|nr:hypothetical protein F2Q70_00022844 [Brassica cretica]